VCFSLPAEKSQKDPEKWVPRLAPEPSSQGLGAYHPRWNFPPLRNAANKQQKLNKINKLHSLAFIPLFGHFICKTVYFPCQIADNMYVASKTNKGRNRK
jgi:hypothetical protein